MDFKGLEKLTIGDLLPLNELETMPLKEGMPIIRQFRDEHGLNDAQAKNAYFCAQRLINDAG